MPPEGTKGRTVTPHRTAPQPTAPSTIIFDRDEVDLIRLAGCTLDRSPGSNWVQDSGGLPRYICEIARAIHRSGRPISQAISIAVSRVKKWAAGLDDVDADTRAKAAKAVAQWEALKAKNKAKKGAKKAARAAKGDGGDNKVRASGAPSTVDFTDMVCLAASDFNVDAVRKAYDLHSREVRKAWRQANPSAAYDDGPGYHYVKEMWTSHLIVETDRDAGPRLYKVPYTVDAKQNVTFADPVEVKTQYVAVKTDEAPGASMSDDAIKALMATDALAEAGSALQTVLLAARTCTPAADLDTILRLARKEPNKPYGNVTYADPGYKGGRRRYPIDTEAHVRAAWSYINQKDNQSGYTPDEVAAIKAKIRAAAKRFGIATSAD